MSGCRLQALKALQLCHALAFVRYLEVINPVRFDRRSEVLQMAKFLGQRH